MKTQRLFKSTDWASMDLAPDIVILRELKSGDIQRTTQANGSGLVMPVSTGGKQPRRFEIIKVADNVIELYPFLQPGRIAAVIPERVQVFAPDGYFITRAQNIPGAWPRGYFDLEENK